MDINYLIARKGKKTDRTYYMENMIFEYFKDKYQVELESEVRLRNDGIADFYKDIYVNKNYTEEIIVEVKQSAQDFYSGHGLNFFEDTSNYVAVPSELVGFAIVFLRENCPFGEFVGIIEVTDKGLVRTVRFPRLANKLDITPYHLLPAKYKHSERRNQ